MALKTIAAKRWMSYESKSNSEIVLYQTEDGRTRIQCRFEAAVKRLPKAAAKPRS